MSDAPQPAQLTAADLLHARAADPGTALVNADGSWTWQEFVEQCAIRAAALSAIRAEGPWHVGVLMDNDPEYLFLIGGAALCGATIVGINPTRRGAELRNDILRTDCQTVIVGESYRELAADFAADVDTLHVADTAYQHLLGRCSDSRPRDWTDTTAQNHTLLLLFTSGSTGAPKAVKCSSARLAAIGSINIHNATADDVAYNAMPLFHGNALMSAWAPILYAGGTYAIRSRFSASAFRTDIQRFGATFFNYVGRSLAYILAQPESPDEADNNLRFGWGTEASPRDREEFVRRYGAPIIESYGSSEGVCVIVRDETTPLGALGKPNPMLGMEVLNDEQQPCPPARFDEHGVLVNPTEAIGEIVARGGALRFEGYYNNPEATAEKIRGGDYWSGDLAYVDEDGVYWFAGRTNDWIRVDSENFSTAPLERIVARYPAIRGATAYAVPDPRTGDRVMVAVEPVSGEAFDVDDFARFLDAQPDIGTKWWPQLIRVTERFPLTATRKLDKGALRRRAWHTDDPVYEWQDGAYQLLDAQRIAALAEEFDAHDRTHLIPAATDAAQQPPAAAPAGQ
ncbi:AMP-binding protein [Gordonia sp. X0973]|uniref:AMP-binding protein n=1 Tax=Gordonia sp. X0973 TaxID=2742602 RepID=UPI000F53FE18|nr:AMP-binding protein [Gordonia sp. X0973]QKT07067.1 AMP-binding protein [Gordonia sp. X0973]